MICDLGMPRDVDPAVAGLPGVYVVDMDRIQREPSARAAASDAEAARTIVAAEVANYLAGQRMAEVTPTVTALRQRAADVVEAELLRLDNRLPGLDAAHRDEVARPSAASSTSCCTRRRCGSSSWPAHPAATATPRRCASCSNSTRRPSTPSPQANCPWCSNRSRPTD